MADDERGPTDEQEDGSSKRQSDDSEDEKGSGDAKAQAEDKEKDLDKRMKELEENPPEKLEDWPTDDLKMRTFGGREGTHGYEEGPEAKLGPSDLRYHEDGKVTIGGEEVDDPDKYKTHPIPGGPTDPDAPSLSGED